jgi:uncharacterized phage protein (TIGR02220 family)
VSAKYQSLQALWSVRDDRTLSASEQRVLLMLVAHANDQGTCWPSTGTLAEEARMHRTAVRDAIERLETRDGPIRVHVERDRVTEKGDADTHLYTLTPGRGWVESEPTLGAKSTNRVGAKSTKGGLNRYPEEERKQTVEEESKETAVFDCWSSRLWLAVHKTGTPQRTKGRIQHIRARLNDGFTAEQLMQVITNVAGIEFYMGTNDRGTPYIEPKTIFKSREKVEELLTVRQPARKAGPSVQRGGYTERPQNDYERRLEAELARLEAEERGEVLGAA